VTTTFSYHRTVAPMLWAIVALAVAELLLVHLFVSLRWPALAWPLFALTGGSVLGLVAWIRSLRRHPHELDGGSLELRIGSLRKLRIPLDAIESVSTSWASGEHKDRGAINTVPVAFPNRLLRLKTALSTRKGPCHRVALRVDDPAPFDAAMKSRGVRLE
jgi:hypothetical protein